MEGGGIKISDLALFREASHSRSINITQTGGDVFITSAITSDMAVLWGENFGAKERKFLRELFTTERVCFSLEDTYQMHVRTLWHSSAMGNHLSNASHGLRRLGKFCLLLHDLSGELTTSWTLVKFVRPLYRRNFSVLSIDLPGYGKSAVGQVCSCPLSKWEAFCSPITTKIMEELGLAKCHFMAVGNSANMLMQIMLSTPHRCEGRHVMINPIFNRNQLFGYVGSDLEPPPGAKKGWRQVIKEKQMTEFCSVVRTLGFKMWFIFNRDGKHKYLESGKKAPDRQTQEEWERAADTYEFLEYAVQDEFAAANIKLSEVTDADLCEAQCGKRVPIRMLVPSRHLKSSVGRYLADHMGLPWSDAYMPKHVLHTLRGHTSLDHALGLDLEAHASDDSDNEANNGPVGITDFALALRGQTKSKDAPVDTLVYDRHRKELVTPQKKKREGKGNSKENQLALKGSPSQPSSSTTRLKPIEGYTPSESLASATMTPQPSRKSTKDEGGDPRRSASESPLRPKSKLLRRDSTLGAAALVAHDRLRKTGVLTRPVPISAQALKEQKQMNWSQVPYEPDLSYGVRKGLLDALEASVETYKVEQEKEMLLREKHLARTAFNAGKASKE